MRPHRRQPTRLPHPWDSPGKNTGMGCHCLLRPLKGNIPPNCPFFFHCIFSCALPMCWASVLCSGGPDSRVTGLLPSWRGVSLGNRHMLCSVRKMKANDERRRPKGEAPPLQLWTTCPLASHAELKGEDVCTDRDVSELLVSGNKH